MSTGEYQDMNHLSSAEIRRLEQSGRNLLMLCYGPPGADEDGTSIIPLYGGFLPTIGDRINLRNGKMYKVVRVDYRETPLLDDRMHMLTPTVYAVEADPD